MGFKALRLIQKQTLRFLKREWAEEDTGFRLFLSILFLTGIIFWLLYLHSDHVFYLNHDWPNINFYLGTLSQAIRTIQLPWHTQTLVQGTDRFLANPETILSPQILLLALLSPKQFVLVNSILLYTIGFLGLCRLGRFYSLGAFSFAILFVLFNFNGHLLAHVSVGHYMWLGYFFLPFFVLCVSQIYTGDHTPSAPVYLGLTLLAVVLQGSVHIFAFCLMFLVLALIFNQKQRRTIFWALLFSVLLAACRLWPAALIYFFQSWASGYPTIAQLVGAFTVATLDNQFLIRETGFWEYNLFVGIVGCIFLVAFGALPLLSQKKLPAQFHAWALPILAMCILSIGRIYQSIVEFLQIPYLEVERVPSRFLILPFQFLLLIAVVHFDRWLRAQKNSDAGIFFVIGLFTISAYELVWNARIWRLHAIGFRFIQDEGFAGTIPISSLTSKLDPVYFLTVVSAWLITLSVLALLIQTRLRKRR